MTALVIPAVSGGGGAEVSHTAAISDVPSSDTSVTILEADTGRLGATVVNDSEQVLYLTLGDVASVSQYSVRLLPAAYYEVPFGYLGVISGIWDGVDGAARVTEFF